MTALTSRERVRRALHHEEPDRVPLDVGGGQSTAVVVEAYEKLDRHLGIQSPTVMMNEALRLVRLDGQTQERLGSDVVPVRLKAPRNWRPPASEPGTFVDEWGQKWRRVDFPAGHYYEPVTFPLAEATIADLDSYRWPDPDDPGRYEGLREEVERLYHETPYALLGDCGFKCFWETALMLLGFQRALTDIVGDEEFMHAFFEKVLDISLTATRRFLEITGPYLTAIRTSDDLGTQDSLLMSPATYRKMIQGVHKRYFALIKEYTDATIFFHCDGNITGVIDDLLEAGIEALNPIQVSALDDPAALKTKYGERLSFWGCIDTHHVLPFGTPDDVREEVRLRIRQFGEGGGFVAASVHNIQADVPPENIVAMCDAVHEFGVYPISLN